MALTLRPLEVDDVDEIVALALRAWEPVFASMARVLGPRVNSLVYPDWAASQEHDVRRACSNPDMQVTVALDGETILGFATVVVHSEQFGEIDMIAVDPAAQGRGVGRALMEHALTQIREAGCSLAVVGTGGDDGHAPARALYESTGFTGLPLVRYYREP
jgi:ribosomal protein S18 acetylase RimI-like enzyme